MPLNKFIPLSPDLNITKDSDMGMAQFGHLNTIVDYLNTYVAADSLQLDGTGPLSATARYITDSAGNLSSLAISTGNVGIGTTAPAGKFDIVSDGGGQLLFSRYGGQPQINIRRSQGTFAAPTAVISGASSVLNFQNYDGTSFGTSAQIQSVPTENQTPTAKGASLALNVVQTGTTSVINGLIVSGATTTAGSVSITTNSSTASARLSIWQTALSSTLPYFNILEIGGGKLLEFSNAGNLLVGSGSPSDTARVSIKGSGSTSATTSFLVQNSLGQEALKVSDDLVIRSDNSQLFFTNATPIHRIGNFQFNGGTLSNFTILTLSGTGGVSFIDPNIYFATNSLINLQGFIPGNNTKVALRISGSFTNAGAGLSSFGTCLNFNTSLNTSVGTVTLNHLSVTNTINTTAGTTLQRGFFYDPILTGTVGFTHCAFQCTSGGAYINTATPSASAALQADSTTQGFLPPRMTTAQKNAIATPAAGLMIYDTDLNRPCFYNGAWITL